MRATTTLLATTILLATALLAATVPPTPAEAQSLRPIEELRGSVAASVFTVIDGEERDRRGCDADDADIERRVRFILNQTRLVLTRPFDQTSIERHSEYQRLLAAREAAVRALPPSVTSSPERHFAALAEADRPLEPWRHPLWLQAEALTLSTAAGTCAQVVNFTVSGSIAATRMLSSGVNTIRSPVIFSRSAIAVGSTSGAREQRARLVEQFARDFANAWAEANR